MQSGIIFLIGWSKLTNICFQKVSHERVSKDFAKARNRRLGVGFEIAYCICA